MAYIIGMTRARAASRRIAASRCSAGRPPRRVRDHLPPLPEHRPAGPRRRLNESLTSRGSFPLSTPALFERWVFSKPYFDPDGLILATEPDGRVIGFALAGFGPNPELTALSHDEGVIGAVLVRPNDRRKGTGRELVRRCGPRR